VILCCRAVVPDPRWSLSFGRTSLVSGGTAQIGASIGLTRRFRREHGEGLICGRGYPFKTRPRYFTKTPQMRGFLFILSYRQQGAKSALGQALGQGEVEERSIPTLAWPLWSAYVRSLRRSVRAGTPISISRKPLETVPHVVQPISGFGLIIGPSL